MQQQKNLQLLTQCSEIQQKYYRIILKDINLNIHYFQIQKNKKVKQLKQIIYQSVNALNINRFNLLFNKQLMNQVCPITFYFQNYKQKIQIQQTKVQLNQISNIFIRGNQLDISTFQYTEKVKLQCNHYISRNQLQILINKQLSAGEQKYQILCQQFEQGIKCQKPIQFSLMKRIGCFTLQQSQKYQTELSLNYIKHNSIICPWCEVTTIRLDKTTNRVCCTLCNGFDFCCRCKNKWKTMDKFYCGNKNCQEINNLLSNSDLSCIFYLQDLKKNTDVIINGPKYRCCPNCNFLIQFQMGCKHVNCLKCKRQFCWICLSIREYGQKWSCEQPLAYCFPLKGPQSSKKKFQKSKQQK